MIFEHAAMWAAVLGAVAYGTGDFLGGCGSRRLSSVSAVAIAQGIAVVFLLQDYALVQRTLPAGAQSWISVMAGIAYAIGVISIYEGIAHGRIAIVASISGLLSIAVPIAGDFMLGRTLSTNEMVGMVLCAGSALLIVGASKAHGRAPAGWSVRVGVTSGIAFGAADLGLGTMPPELAAGALLMTRCTSAAIALLFVLGIASRISSKLSAPNFSSPTARMASVDVSGAASAPIQFMPASHSLVIGIALSAVAGLLDALGHVGYVHAATRGSMGVAAALVAIFPAVTVLLATVLLRERITRAQMVGFGLGASGILFITG